MNLWLCDICGAFVEIEKISIKHQSNLVRCLILGLSNYKYTPTNKLIN